MATPYVTPQMLINAPTGIGWATIPRQGASADEQYKAQLAVCQRVTNLIDGYCNQPLRSTLTTENLTGPNTRVTIGGWAVTNLFLHRWPVQNIQNILYGAQSSFPIDLQQIPSTMYAVNNQMSGPSAGVPDTSGAGPTSIRIAPGYIDWSLGRNGFVIEITYIAGFPHCGIVTGASEGDTALTVDDCTGFIEGTVATLYDGGSTEYVVVASASAISGPGVLTVAPLLYDHTLSPADAPLVLSTLPEAIQSAAIQWSISEALIRGATATAITSVPGTAVRASGSGPEYYAKQARSYLEPFRRRF